MKRFIILLLIAIMAVFEPLKAQNITPTDSTTTKTVKPKPKKKTKRKPKKKEVSTAKIIKIISVTVPILTTAVITIIQAIKPPTK